MEQQQHGANIGALRPVRSRRSVLRAAATGSVALVALHAPARAMQANGSISVQGYLCPSADAAQGDCQITDEIFEGDIVLSGPNGLVLTLDDGESHAVSHVWYGLPYGSYEMQAIGAAPSGYVLDHIDGATIDDAGFEAIVLDDDNPSPSVNLIYVPAG